MKRHSLWLILVTVLCLLGCSAENRVELDDELPPPLTTAMTLAYRAGSDYDRVEGFLLVSGVLLDGGRVRQATTLLHHAQGVAEKIEIAEIRARRLSGIAQQYAQVGEIDLARATLESIDPSPAYMRGVGDVVEVLAKAGEIEVGRQVLDDALSRIGEVHEQSRPDALRILAAAYRQVGDAKTASSLLDRAIAATVGIEMLDVRAWARFWIASEYVHLGDLGQSLAVAKGIEDDNVHGNTLYEIGRLHLASGDPDLALDTLGHMTGEGRIQYWHAYLLAETAIRLAELEDYFQAFALLKQFDMAYDWHAARAMGQVAAIAWNEPAFRAQAVLALNDASAIVRNLAPNSQALAYAAIAKRFVEIEDHAQAAKLLDKAFESAARLTKRTERNTVYQLLATTHADMGDYSRALAVASELKPGASGHSRALLRTATLQAGSGDFVAALKSVQRIDSTVYRIRALTRLAPYYAEWEHAPDQEEAAILRGLERSALYRHWGFRLLYLLDLLF
ncbi:lipopolysaccharide assembly protein LapB [Desulfonatronum sp. SC1]|uniref:tetratricopeptide repeat protein n=1 Tax=Desulfonatronum sp. SC1 TaxID=2109626 RepID=UPI000D3086FC|nr:hypothetical protein [Desulfonatronum sp. SC1]PTN36779.1 hypothetical protein C6366_09040 [Desulfonatronum sp. SC1]